MSDLNNLTKNRIDIIKSYFTMGDNGNGEIVELFDDNLEMYFPVFGVAKGKNGFMDFVKGMGKELKSLTHDIEKNNYIVGGNNIIVEGTEDGEFKDGKKFSQNKFCVIFSFTEKNKISRMYIYTNPDFAKEKLPRFTW